MTLLALTASAALQARDFDALENYYLEKSLADEGILLEEIASKIDPALLQALEEDAETHYFKIDGEAEQRSIVVSLRADDLRHQQMLAQKSSQQMKQVQQEIRSVQDQVLRQVATKANPGFKLRNRYSVTPGFSARADFRSIAALALQDGVEFVEEMKVFESQALLDTNADETTDTRFAHQDVTGEGVTIAIIDSGVSIDQRLLGDTGFPSSKIIGGYDFGDDDANPKIDCLSDSHGTAVSFIAAGDGGVAPDAKLVFLKVQSDSKCGKSSFDGDIPGAIDWVVANKDVYGIRIISMSLGTTTTYTSCENVGGAYVDAVDRAVAAGLLIVAASGNDGVKDGMAFPACYPSVVSVGAVYDKKFGNTRKHYKSNGKLLCKDKKPSRYEVACYSNSASYLDVLAPADCAKTAWTLPNSTTSCFTGTSAATPFVAGVAALALEKNPSLSREDLRTVITSVGYSTTDPENGQTNRVVNSNLAVVGAGWWPWLF